MGEKDYHFSNVIRTLYAKKVIKDDFFLMDGNFVSEINFYDLLINCRKIKESNKGMIMTLTCQIGEKVEQNSLFIVHNKKSSTLRYLD
jgi:hypothetical protein